MRIRALRIENWKNIRRLDLPELSEQFNVLTAPNQTGKSSIVQAIRACLFDIDHDSSSAEIRAAVPFGTSAIPEVAVEFETGDDAFRVTKRFSPRKDGSALLERFTGSGWKEEVSESKEAGRRVRKLLNAANSSANWYRLLWLDQGTTTLDPNTIDADLRTSIINVLGGMVTGRDRAIEKALQEKAKEFLTPSGRISSKARLAQIEKEKLPQAEAHLAQLRAERNRLEGAMAQIEGLRKRIAALETAIAEAETQSAELAARQNQLAPQQEKRDAVQAQLKAALSQEDSAVRRLAQWGAINQRLASARLEAAELQRRINARLTEHDQLLAASTAAQSARDAARQQLEQLRQQLAALDDGRRLAQARTMLRQAAARTARRDELAQQLISVEQALQPAPTDAELRALSQLWQQLQTSDARLAATAIRVQLAPEQATRVDISRDGTGQQLPLGPQNAATFEWNDQAEIRIPGWGVIRLERSTPRPETELTGRLAQQQDILRQRLAAWDMSPEQDDWLPQLAERARSRSEQTRVIAQVRQELTALDAEILARAGAIKQAEAALAESRDSVAATREAVSLASASPEDLEATAAQLTRELRAADANRRNLEAAATKAESHWRAAETASRKLQQDLAVADSRRTDLAADRDRLAAELLPTGAEAPSANAAEDPITPQLQAAHAAAGEVVVRLRKELDGLLEPANARELTTQLAAAASRLKDLRQQHQLAREELSKLRGNIESSEGNHTRLAEAEHAVEFLRQQLLRERAQAEAHKYLLQLFQDCRQGDVVEMLEPVSRLVSRWAKELGLRDLTRVPLTKELLVREVAIARNGGEHPLDLAHESYGAVEQLSLLVRLALGGILAAQQPRVMMLDDPLAHADPLRHQQMLRLLEASTHGDQLGDPATGPLQLLIFTCHPERFTALPEARHVDLARTGEFFSTPPAAPAQSPRAVPPEVPPAVAEAEPRPAAPPPRRSRNPASAPVGQRGFWE